MDDLFLQAVLSNEVLFMANTSTTCVDPKMCVENFPENITFRNVYPPVEELQPQVLVVTCAFFLCFVVGLSGNSSVLTIICAYFKQRSNRPDRNQTGADIVILYIAALCLVDTLMSLSLPPAIVDSLVGFWLFGTVVCKVHHMFGSVGRIASTFLITAMSFDRYVAVCHPHQFCLRTKRTAVLLIIGLAMVAVLLLMPMLIHAESHEVLVHWARTGNNVITRVRVYKCSDMMPPAVFYWFTVSTFVFGYLVPLVLIVGFNASMIKQLYARNSKLQRSAIPLRRVTIYTALIAACYFVCWTPYWTSVMYAIVQNLKEPSSEEAGDSDSLIYIIYCIHLLPYINSASNWILYGRLNTQLQVASGRHADGSVSGYERSTGCETQISTNPRRPFGVSARSHSLAVPTMHNRTLLTAQYDGGSFHTTISNGLLQTPLINDGRKNSQASDQSNV